MVCKTISKINKTYLPADAKSAAKVGVPVGWYNPHLWGFFGVASLKTGREMYKNETGSFRCPPHLI
jgi:hypothetical protein